MALQKARTFQYRPPRRRLEQLGVSEYSHKGVHIPRAGEGDTSGRAAMLRLIIMLMAVVALALVMASLG